MPTEHVSGIDLLIGGAILLFALRGVFRGFVKELFSLAAVVAAWIVATRYHMALAGEFPPLAGNEFLTAAIVFTVLFLLTALGVRILGIAVHMVLSDTPLGWLNRLAGAACGVFIGTILAGLLLLLLTIYLPGGQTMFARSQLYRPLTGVIEFLAAALPDRGKEIFEKHFERPGDKLPENLKEFV